MRPELAWLDITAKGIMNQMMMMVKMKVMMKKMMMLR